MEKLFVQIFERKNRIIEQVKQQTELYNQNLASKLLIEGITPPSWLWSPTGSSDSKELNKEDLISKLLGQYTLDSIRCSTEQYPLYDKPFISGANREFSDGFLKDTLDNCPSGQGRSVTRGDTDAGCSQNCAPELDFSITSPKDQTTGGFLNISNAPDQSVARIQRSKARQKAPELDFSITSPKDQTIGVFLNISNAPDQSVARIQRSKSGLKAPELDFNNTSPKDQTTGGFLNISNAPDQSVARIQRSKSRQKALELRNSANTVAESALDHESISGILSSGIRLSISSSKQTGNENELPELVEPCAFSGSCYEDLDLDEAACQNKDNGMDLYFGRITRSRSHVEILGSGRTSLELGHSQNDRKDVSFHCANTSKRSSVGTSSRVVADYRNRLLQSPGSSSAFGQNDGDIRFRAGSLSKEKGEVYSGKISSFKSSHRPQSCASGSWKADSFSNDDQRMVGTIMDFGDDLCKNHVDGSPVKKNIFYVGCVDKDGRGSILEDGKSCKESSNISEPVHCSKISSFGGGTLSISSPRKNSAANDKVQNFSGCQTRPPWCETKDMLDEVRNVDFMMNNELVAGNLINRSLSSANGDEQISVSLSSNGAKQRRQLESLVAKDSKNCFMSEKIQQLDFSVFEEQNLKTFSSSLGKKRPDKSPKNVSDRDLLLTQEISNCGYNPSLGGQSPDDSEVRKDVAKVHTNSSECDIHKHVDTCTEKYVSLTSQNNTPKRPQDNIEGGNCQYPEVEDETDIMMSKMVDTPTLLFHPVEQCWEQGYETSAEQVIEEGNWIGEGSLKSSEVSHATGSKDVGQSCFPKLANNPGEESHGFSSGQSEMANPMCVVPDKIEQFPAQVSQILSRLTGVEDNRLVTNYKSTKQGEDLLLEGRFEIVSIGSWPQLKRRKIKELQVNRLTSYPSSVKHVGSIQRDSPNRYLRNIEMDVNTDLTDLLDRKMSIDIEMDQDKDTDCINTENLTHTMRMLQANKSPPSVDGEQSQCLILSPKHKDLKFVAESMPVFEGFNVEMLADNGDLDFAADGVDLAGLRLSRIAIERASIIEEMCRSASLDTPMSHLSSALNFQGTLNPFQSLPNGLLEHMNLKTYLPTNKQLDSGKSLVNDTGSTLERIERVPYSVSLPYSRSRHGWNSRIQHASPVGSLWERLSSHTVSSEKCSISNPELTCFPIEEDPCISEDNKRVDEIVDDVEEETDSLLARDCNVRHPLEDLTNMGLNSSVSTFAKQNILRADTVDVTIAKSNVGGTQDDVQWSLKNKSRYDSEMRENQGSSLGKAKRKSYPTSPIGYDGTKKAKVSIDESVSTPTLSSKTNLKKHEQKISLKDSKRNNIVSNICSFIPLVQQTQAAAAVCAGKRDIKVKALEAAEAAKRLEEKRMNERKNRKEALKLERAKLEAENLRKMELEKKRKELERKKKDADAIAKKRSREEEERREKERKRTRLEARLRLREEEERGHAEKAGKEKRHTKDEKINTKKSYNEFKKEQNRGVVRGDDVASKKTVIEECGVSGDSFEAGKALPTVDRSPKNEDLIVQKRQEKSYEISPYQCSEDEDEEDEELPTKKYIPSWASKSSMGLLLPLQQKMEPDLIFHPESFCCMDEAEIDGCMNQIFLAVTI
ncbi:uncharacterized protein LOC142526796 isoform X2 [Primulina tabacum]|uniref:uncharacterized protein LOC142526796 isoform X2 n=1 Tax=Primulina tabacum TaxID=48773 RepID=UPI003F590BA9